MKHEKFMKTALEECRKGIEEGGGPFGAVIVRKGKILSKAHNAVVPNNDPTCHAEINAIRKAGRKLKTYDLSDCVVYSTTEPCPMCFSAIHWAKIKKIVFGARISDAKKAGLNELEISNETLTRLGKKKTELVPNIMKKECVRLLIEWGNDRNTIKY